MSNYLLSGDAAYLEHIAPHYAQFERWIERMEEFAASDKERALVEQIRREYIGYTAKGDDVIRLSRAGNDAEARRVFISMKRDIDDLLSDGQAVFTLAADDVRARRDAADAMIARQQRLTMTLMIAGAVLSLLVAIILLRIAAKPLYRMVLRLGEQGDSFQFKGDELGALEAHMNALLERVREQERVLREAEKLSELGEIAAEIAHETLNPLAGVKGMLQALQRTPVSTERLASELGAMERELLRVEHIVRRLVRYARPLEPRRRPVSVAEVVRSAIRLAQAAPSAGERHIRVAELDPGLKWQLDPELIEQVLINLLVNACEASRPGDAIDLHVSQASGKLTFVVVDRGVGLPPERQRLFRPFFTTKPNGHGLGLAVSRNIVHEHGGSIEASAEAGGGTRFEVVLPGGLAA